MKPLVVALVCVAGIGVVAVLTGRAFDMYRHDPEGQADEDAYQAQWVQLVDADRGRVPVTCDGCGDWFYADELTRDQCTECRFNGAVARLFDDGGAS